MKTEPPRHPYARIAVYSVIALTLGWIVVSLGLSVGYRIFWEHKIGRAIPKAEFVEIVNKDEALQCVRGLELFHRELVFNAKRFVTRYRLTPATSLQKWERWQTDWRKDFAEFGRRYGFEPARGESGLYRKELAAAYGRIAKLESDYSRDFSRLYELWKSGREEMNSYFQNLTAYIESADGS